MFRFAFTGAAETHVQSIRSHLARAGGNLSGSGTEGSFVLPTRLGRFGGSYSVSGQTVVLEIRDKPFFVPCRLIEPWLAQNVR